jgi:hypothetical protein
MNKYHSFGFLSIINIPKESFIFANSLTRMNRSIYIRKSFAIILLAIFALSNTPTKYLHKLFANHTDFVSKTLTDSNNPQLNVAGINCHCETNVVIAPYTIQSAFIITPVSPVFPEFSFSGIYKITFSESVSFGLRGPPASRV